MEKNYRTIDLYPSHSLHSLSKESIIYIENPSLNSRIVYDDNNKNFYLETRDIATKMSDREFKEKVKEWCERGCIIKEPSLLNPDSIFSTFELASIIFHSTFYSIKTKTLTYLRNLNRKIRSNPNNLKKAKHLIISLVIFLGIIDIHQGSLYIFILPPVGLILYNLIINIKVWANSRQAYYLLQNSLFLILYTIASVFTWSDEFTYKISTYFLGVSILGWFILQILEKINSME